MKLPDHYQSPGPSVALYDVREAGGPGTICDGDVEFYLRHARKTGGPVLDLACGTGRVALPLARAGFDVTGLDRSRHMLAIARGKLKANGIQHVELVTGNMVRFDLRRRFRLVVIAYRAFQHLLTPDDQRRCLTCVYKHLSRGGRLIVHLFDPRLDYCLPVGDVAPKTRAPVRDPRTGHVVDATVVDRRPDPLTQIVSETWQWTERDKTGTVVSRSSDILRVRWTYRFEMQYLFELAGFTMQACYSDFFGHAPRYGAEQIWIVAK